MEMQKIDSQTEDYALFNEVVLRRSKADIPLGQETAIVRSKEPCSHEDDRSGVKSFLLAKTNDEK